jgi:hypothetical protein
MLIELHRPYGIEELTSALGGLVEMFQVSQIKSKGDNEVFLLQQISKP